MSGLGLFLPFWWLRLLLPIHVVVDTIVSEGGFATAGCHSLGLLHLSLSLPLLLDRVLQGASRATLRVEKPKRVNKLELRSHLSSELVMWCMGLIVRVFFEWWRFDTGDNLWSACYGRQ